MTFTTRIKDDCSQKATMTEKNIIVVGGGAAGLFVAMQTAEALQGVDGVKVTIIEPNDRMGKKLRITGKGRCNLTNDCDRDTFLANVPTNPRFLYAAFNALSPQNVMEIFESLGVPLKVERGHRVFPVSDNAHDIADAMVRRCRSLAVEFVHDKVTGLLTEDVLEATSKAPNSRIVGVMCGSKTYPAHAVVICTGGCSYPTTGSDGSGYRLASQVGHTIVPPIPSLVPLVCAGKICSDMMGLSLRNVRLEVYHKAKKKVIFEDFGEMLFTHFGVTGPLILSASAHMPDLVAGKYELRINLKPALTEQELDTRILSDFKKYANRDFINALSDLLPLKAIEPVVRLSGIDPRKKVNAITKEERASLLSVIRSLTIEPVSHRPIKEAIVTKGGVAVKEVDPGSMASKKCEGLYFAGEILDVDAYTGGFNLQIAFATAHLAAMAMAQNVYETINAE